MPFLETVHEAEGVPGLGERRERGHGPKGFLPGVGGGKVRQQDSYSGEVKPIERTTVVH
jgi:hypothetical protein